MPGRTKITGHRSTAEVYAKVHFSDVSTGAKDRSRESVDVYHSALLTARI
jgi:hypothetical protein